MNEIEILAKLISFNTVSKFSNKNIISFISSYLSQFGIKAIIIPTSYDKNKYNLFARIDDEKLNRSNNDAGLAFSGHTDVVSTEGQKWSYDPFKLSISGDRLFGRGTSDMKGFIASCLAMVPTIRNMKLSKPIYYIFSADEEVGCIGIDSLAKEIGKSLPNIDLIWVGEPTDLEVLAKHKSILTCRLEFFAKGGHSSLIPYKSSAIYLANDFFNRIQELQLKLKNNKTDKSFTPDFTTIHVGVFRGGQSTNIIANDCVIEIDIRSIPKDNPQEIYKTLEKLAKESIKSQRKANQLSSFKITQTAYVPAFDCSDESSHNHKAVFFAKKVLNKANTITAAFATEAAIFQKYNIPCVVSGLSSGKLAHQADEFINISDLDQSRQMFMKIMNSLTIS